MTGETASNRGWPFRAGIFALLLACGILVFVPAYLSSAILVYVRFATALVLLAVAVLFRRGERLREYWQIPLALGTAATAMLISAYWGDWLLGMFEISTATVSGIALSKLSEALWICLSIVAVTVLFGVDMGTIFFKRGKLKQGLLIGLLAFFLLAVIAAESGRRWSYTELCDLLLASSHASCEAIVAELARLQCGDAFEDDLSLLKVVVD